MTFRRNVLGSWARSCASDPDSVFAVNLTALFNLSFDPTETLMRPIAEMIEVRRTDQDVRRAIQEKLDEFLDVYSFYCKTQIAWIHDEARLKAYELNMLDSRFNFRC